MTDRELSDEPIVGWRCCAMWRKSAGTWRRLVATTASAGSATTAGSAASRPTASTA